MKLRNIKQKNYLGCTFETVRFMVLVGRGVPRPGKGGEIPKKGREILPLGIGNRQENLGC